MKLTYQKRKKKKNHIDGEIEEYVNYRIRGGWMKWRCASRVWYDCRIPIKLGNFYKIAIRLTLLYGTEC